MNHSDSAALLTEQATPCTPSVWPAVFASLRPRQWIKNGFVLAAIVFSGKMWEPDAVWRSALALVSFCGLSSSVYLINDWMDREWDRRHPRKRQRPIAAGIVGEATALRVSAVLATVSLAASAVLGPAFVTVAGAYLLAMLAYCYMLKRVVVLDVACVSLGFVLRAVAGAAAIGVWISEWLVLCTAAVSLFLGFAKRRHELELLGESAATHRPVLARYRVPWLDLLIVFSTAGCLLSYGLYCVFSNSAAQHPAIILSLPFVVIGVGRYLWHVYRRNGGGSPDEIVLGDPWFAANGALWLVAVVGAIAY